MKLLSTKSGSKGLTIGALLTVTLLSAGANADIGINGEALDTKTATGKVEKIDISRSTVTVGSVQYKVSRGAKVDTHRRKNTKISGLSIGMKVQVESRKQDGVIYAEKIVEDRELKASSFEY